MFPYRVIVICFLFFFPFTLFSQDNEKEILKDKKAKLQKQIKLTSTLLEKAKKRRTQSVTTLNTLSSQIQSRQEIIYTLNIEVNLAEKQIEKLKNEIHITNQSLVIQQELLDSLKLEYSLMIRHAYFNRNAHHRLAFVFSSQSYNQAFKRLKYLKEYSLFRQKQSNEILAVEKQLSDKLLKLKQQRVLLLVAKNEKRKSLKDSEEEISILANEKSTQSTLLSGLKKKEKQLKKDLQSKKNLAIQLDQKIRKIIEEEIRVAKAKSLDETSFLELTPEQQIISDNFTSNKGSLPWPVERGVIVERFGVQSHPVLKGIETFNNGVKITTEEGAIVRSIFEGRVSRIIDIPGAGKAVIVSHGDYFTVYSNLFEVSVTRGERVLIKEKLGTVITKNNGAETITELQIWRGSEKIDPSSWLFQAYK